MNQVPLAAALENTRTNPMGLAGQRRRRGNNNNVTRRLLAEAPAVQRPRLNIPGSPAAIPALNSATSVVNNGFPVNRRAAPAPNNRSWARATNRRANRANLPNRRNRIRARNPLSAPSSPNRFNPHITVAIKQTTSMELPYQQMTDRERVKNYIVPLFYNKLPEFAAFDLRTAATTSTFCAHSSRTYHQSQWRGHAATCRK